MVFPFKEMDKTDIKQPSIAKISCKTRDLRAFWPLKHVMRRALRRLSRVVGHDEAKEALNLMTDPKKRAPGLCFEALRVISTSISARLPYKSF